MTKGPGSQSTSMSTTTHQVRLHPVVVPSRYQGHWEPGDEVLMLRSGSCYVSPKVKNLQSSVSSTPCRLTTKPRRSQSSLSKCCQNSKRSLWEASEVMGRGENIKIWHFWWASYSRSCQLRDIWTHGRGFQRPQLTHILVQEEAPIQDVQGERYRGQKGVPNVEIWLVEDANFLTKLVNQLKPGFWKNVFKAFQMPADGSWRCYTLREALGDPGDAENTSTKAFYQHLWMGTFENSKKTSKRAIFDRISRGPHWTHSDLPRSGGPPEGLETFLHHLWHRKTTTTSLSENHHIMALPGLGSFMEIGQSSTMRCARLER